MKIAFFVAALAFSQIANANLKPTLPSAPVHSVNCKRAQGSETLKLSADHKELIFKAEWDAKERYMVKAIGPNEYADLAVSGVLVNTLCARGEDCGIDTFALVFDKDVEQNEPNTKLELTNTLRNARTGIDESSMTSTEYFCKVK